MPLSTESALKKKETMKKGKKTVRIDQERCKGCNLCIHVCPKDALMPSKDVNKKGLPYVILRDPDKCTGCGMCALMCPDLGIEVVYFEHEE